MVIYVLIGVDSYGCICVWHFTSQKCLTTLIEERQTLNAAYAHDCKYFASVGSDRAVLVYSDETNQIASKLEPRCLYIWRGVWCRVEGVERGVVQVGGVERGVVQGGGGREGCGAGWRG